jgi:hypothetical protein
MPKFDFTQNAPNQQAVTAEVSSRGAQIAGQAQQQVGSAVASAGDTMFNIGLDIRKQEDESDMVGARSALMRIQQQESEELRSTSSPAEMDKIHDKYGKQYDSVVSGVDPQFGNPYFRNETGKDQFKVGFMQSFNAKRGVSKEEQKFQLERKNTQQKYHNGIQTVRDSDYVFDVQAEVETNEYIDKLVEGGFMTHEQGKEKKRTDMLALDATRANKSLSVIELVPFRSPDEYIEEDYGKALKSDIDEYKSKVDDLKFLNQDEKNDYKRQADRLFKSKKDGFKLEVKDAKDRVKKDQSSYDAELSYRVMTGDIPAHIAHQDKNASWKMRESLSKIANTQGEKRKSEGQDPLGQEFVAKVESAVYEYDEQDDPDGKKMEAIRLNINKLPSGNVDKARYLEVLVNGQGLNSSDKAELDQMGEEMKYELGLDVKLNTDRDAIVGREGFDVEDGLIMKDKLNQFERQKIYNKAYKYMLNKMKRGKVDEAKSEFREVIKGIQKEENDRVYYDGYIDQDFITTGAK